ncbi:hypothetical protein Y032_0033g2791 [Ancylostoma ceylanicum]|uniref:Tc1-like transposase DDE domain-containing protein n=1 Tax=Ancylostoma ceylanicum TaxID=53326 RepID=A0A016UQB8_9BILA|nr:hypothetical protein Y032_0033g2791 [Ancylostoma ceylanicum]
MLYYELLPIGHTVTGTIYANQLQKLAEGDSFVREGRSRRASVHLLNDSASPHEDKETCDKLEELGWDTVPHPPYSPNNASSDHHLFHLLKEFLAKKKLTRIENVKRAVSGFFDSHSPQSWEKGIANLPFSCNIVVTGVSNDIVK